MNTTDAVTIPPDVIADLEYALRLATTGERDEAFEQRIRAEAEQLTGEIQQRRGVLNVAVDLIREGREEK